ncbi:Palmitoyl-CoA hydrolase [Bertholletia excelsa]
MKLPRSPVPHQMFKTSSHIGLRLPKPNHNSLIRELVSYYLTLDSPKPRISPSKTLRSPPPNRINYGSNGTLSPDSAFCDPTPSSDLQFDDFGHTKLLNSFKQSKSTMKTNFGSTIHHATYQSSEFVNSCMFCLSNKSIPIIRTTLYDPTLPKLIQQRSFSKDSDLTESNLFESSRPLDAGSSNRKPISLWPGIYHSPATNALWEARGRIFEATSDPSDSELITKSPSQSRTSIVYNFSTDNILREQYRNPWNEIRTGKLLEDLDALAGTISYKHCCNNDGTTRSLLLVTASVDRMVLKKPIHIDSNMKLSGAVTWVGRSSMEIQLEVTQSSNETPNSSDSIALTANFTFVARDRKTGKSALINQIQPETEQEKMLWREAEERKKVQNQQRGQPKEVEDGDIDSLKDLLAEGRIFCDMPALADRDSILMKDTSLQNSLICQPQKRNIHGRIFGGFLMRRAFELAFATAYAFAGIAPHFLEVDHVDFLKPVDVGNFLRLKSCVMYTELQNPAQPLINVEVIAHVTRPESRSSEVSNNFYFTFTVPSKAVENGLMIRNVVPGTEEEARRVIERMDAEGIKFTRS